MAMSLALVGLKVPGVVIDNPGCVAKTYPGFWQDLENCVSSCQYSVCQKRQKPGTQVVPWLRLKTDY